MSAKVVVPDSIISSAASLVPARTNSGETVFDFGREDVVVQPLHQRQVVGQSAIEHHRRVRVGVDQPRQHDLTGGIDRLAPAKLLRDGGGRVHGRDVRAVDRDRTGFNDPACCVNGDDGSARDHQVHFAQTSLSGHDNHHRQGDGGHGGEPGAHKGILVVFQPCPFT